jgi:hypothetical protein
MQFCRSSREKPEHEVRQEVVQRSVEVIKTSTALLTSRISNNPASVPLNFQRIMRSLRELWLRNFGRFNLVQFNSLAQQQQQQFTRSVSDYGFVAMCMGTLGLDKGYVEPLDPRAMITIVQCHIIQTVMCSNHDMRMRTTWPSQEHVDDFLALIARVVDCHFRSAAQMPSLVALLEGADCAQMLSGGTHSELPASVAEDPDAFLSLSRQLRLYEECRMPADLARQLREASDEAKAKAATIRENRNVHMPPNKHDAEEDAEAKQQELEAEDDALKEESEESKGYMWRTTSEELIAQFVPKMARFMWKVLSDREFLALYPPDSNEIIRFDAPTISRVHHFLADTCRSEQDDFTLAEFRAFTAEYCLPVGWEMHNSRFVAQEANDDPKLAADILSDMLGVRLTGFVRESTATLMIDIVSQSVAAKTTAEESIHYQAVFLTQVNAFFKRKQKFIWSDHYYCVLPHASHWRNRLASDFFRGEVPTAIVVKNVEKGFHVFHRKKLWPCGDSFIPAFCLWMQLCHQDRATTRGDDDDLYIPIDNGADVAAMYLLLQPRMQLPESVQRRADALNSAAAASAASSAMLV